MTSIEISHLIATEVKGWTQLEGIAYQDKEGNVYYLPNYPDSIAHALDLAMVEKISLMPLEDGTWRATALLNSDAFKIDANPGMAICLATLAAHNIEA
jgi:hypothetical protein